MGIYLILFLFMALAWYASNMLKRKFELYSQTPLRNGLSGAEAAARMLKDHKITGVQILNVDGKLTDHYNPLDKTVNLSNDVYYGRHAAAVAVATHEVGHAVQHATAYSWLQFRSAMVPFLKYGSVAFPFLLMGGMLLTAVSTELGLLSIIGALIIQAAITLFSLITLPVEYDASRRALAWMENGQIVTTEEHAMAKDALTWAARTYLIAALQAVVMLLYYVWMFFGRRD